MLEELGLPYQVKPIDILNQEQFAPGFLEISPNNRVPAIVDHDTPHEPQSVFESGTILVYLAEKTGKYLAQSGPARVAALEWLFWQVSGLGPMAGQAHHFVRYAPPGNEYGTERYIKESTRLYGVMDRRLQKVAWLAGDEYSIADMASWGWVWFHRMHGQSLNDFPNVARWFFAMAERPAVSRARQVGLDLVDHETKALQGRPFWDVAATHASDKTEIR